jgi:hypothetical protein
MKPPIALLILGSIGGMLLFNSSFTEQMLRFLTMQLPM